MAEGTERAITFERTAVGEYLVTNVRGGTLTVGTGDADFTAVELLLTAIGTCSAVDVDLVTTRRAEPVRFSGSVRGDKIRDEHGNRMENLELVFTITFPDGDVGEAARAALPRAVQMSHDRLCTVTRTVELATPVVTRVDSPPP